MWGVKENIVWGCILSTNLFDVNFFFSQEWDIDALEQSTRYDGFTAEHPVIV